MWNFSFPYKLKQLIDLACQRNMLFTFDGKKYGPALNIDKAFVVYVRGQSEEAGFQTLPPPGFEYVTKYVKFWLHFIGVRSITAMTVEHTWDGRAQDMIEEGEKQAAKLAKQFESNGASVGIFQYCAIKATTVWLASKFMNWEHEL
ncbi:MAG: acpD4 [Bradyrhizobium sp.]|nr:acpD4 [Bradyrhizobium sp.]